MGNGALNQGFHEHTNEFRWQAIPYWFAATAGLVYATGFLVEFTFHNSMGLRMASTEIFKAKYIYVGLLCLQFPASVLALLWGYHRFKSKEKESGLPVYFSYFVLMAILLFVFYLMTTFARSGEFHERRIWIMGLFMFETVAVSSIRWTQDRKSV